MHIVATCPVCGTEIVMQTAECAICGRRVPAGEYVIAPKGSRYDGAPICADCIDRIGRKPAVGPWETKG